MEGLTDRPAGLEELLSREWPQDLTELTREEQEGLKLLRHHQELARGLVDSEYWELIRFLIVSDLEAAKSALEDTEISEKDFRVKQGEARALLSFHNFILKLSKIPEEKENGEE